MKVGSCRQQAQSSRVFLFFAFASPVSLDSSEPVESAGSIVPSESLTMASSGLFFLSMRPAGWVCVDVGFGVMSGWMQGERSKQAGWMETGGLGEAGGPLPGQSNSPTVVSTVIAERNFRDSTCTV